MSRKKLTFVGTSVLITATVGQKYERRLTALRLLGDRRREFVATDFLRLEVLPIPLRHGFHEQVKFYEAFFRRVAVWIEPQAFLDDSCLLACKYGLGAMDALHVAAAASVSAEFVSAEKSTKPLYQAYIKAIALF